MIRDRPKSRRTRNTTFLTNHGVPLRYLATGHYWLYLNLTYRTVLGVPPVPVGLASARLRRPIGTHAFRHVRTARPPGTRFALAGSRMVPPPGTSGTAWYRRRVLRARGLAYTRRPPRGLAYAASYGTWWCRPPGWRSRGTTAVLHYPPTGPFAPERRR